MRNETRLAFNAYLAQIAQLNGITNPLEKFTAAPSVQQTLEQRMQESSQFLSAINIIGVTEQTGQKLGLGVGSPIASTTNTSTTDRVPKDPTSVDELDDYICTQTNFDTLLKYGKLDAWAKFPNFQTMIRDAILKRQALDRMTIGFNGVSRAATSDLGANPLLQDVNKGWLQKWREHAPERVLAEVVEDSGHVTYGEGGDYENLDAIVYDAINNLLPAWYQDAPELVAIVGRDLLHDKYFPMVNQDNRPVDTVALDLILSQRRLGGLQAVRVPYFPAGKILITQLSNLSIYWQENTRRRTVLDNAKRDQIENYESVNECYVVEDYQGGCIIENITKYVPAH